MLVVGVKQQIDELIRRAGAEPCFVGGYRVTDPAAMTAAAEATGAARAEVEARLSKVRHNAVLILVMPSTEHPWRRSRCYSARCAIMLPAALFVPETSNTSMNPTQLLV